MRRIDESSQNRRKCNENELNVREETMSKEVATQGLNRAKPYQLVLFPFNNGATNVYYILTATYIAYYGNGVLGLALMFATTMVTVMRLLMRSRIRSSVRSSIRRTVASVSSARLWFSEM